MADEVEILETIKINETNGIYWKGVHFPIGTFKIYVDELNKLQKEREEKSI